jgi:hypothetical protein
MKRIGFACVIAVAATCNGALGAATNLDQWFTTATQFNALTSATAIAHPDFLGGTSRAAQCRFELGGKLPAFQNGIWQLVRYDRVHHIGLAMATTDQESCAIFLAPPPGVSAPDADLSSYRTGRGLKIGSSYEQVLSLYGGPRKSGQRFVTAYVADVPAVSMANKPLKLPETITIVVDRGTVSAITVSIDLGGLF